MVFVVFSALVDVIHESLDAQSLQDVSEVLLLSVLAVLVSQEDACLCLACLTASELVHVEHTASQVGGLCFILVEDVEHVGTRVKVLNNHCLALHQQMLRVEELSTERAHRLKGNVACNDYVRLFAAFRVAARSVFALFADQFEQLARLLGDDDERGTHDQAIEYLREMTLRVDLSVPHSRHSNHHKVDAPHVVGSEGAPRDVVLQSDFTMVRVHQITR